MQQYQHCKYHPWRTQRKSDLTIHLDFKLYGKISKAKAGYDELLH